MSSISTSFTIYLWVAVGIVVSFLIPILKKFIVEANLAGMDGIWEKIWEKIKPYVYIVLLSLLTAIVIVALTGDTLKDWRAAILAGYAWDSTLQKGGL